MITCWLLALGAILTLAAMAYAGSSLASLVNVFTLWALLPYGVLLLSRFWARSLIRAWVVLGSTTLTVGFAMLAYANSVRPSSGPTSSLAFVAVPLYQLVVATLLLGLLFFTRSLGNRRP